MDYLLLIFMPENRLAISVIRFRKKYPKVYPKKKEIN